MWIQGLLSRPPASSSSTRYRPDSLSRPATAQPADPAPVTMKSKVSSALVAILYPQRCAATITKPAGIWKAGLPVPPQEELRGIAKNPVHHSVAGLNSEPRSGAAIQLNDGADRRPRGD